MGVAIDSKQVCAGDLFFALKGKRVDGHAFLKEAQERGAIGAIVDQHYRGEDFGLPFQRVPNVLEALQKMAQKHLQDHPKRVIAISGSLGKTTTKCFTKTFLEPYFKVYASPKSYNSQLTVPLSILNSDPDAEILILEMGMSEPGNLKKLIEIAPPEVALLTTVALQHADGFPEGLSGIFKEKISLFSHPQTKLGIYFEELGDIHIGSCKKKTFSLEYFDCPFPKQIQHCISAAAAIANAFGIEDVRDRIAFLQLPPMRFERIEKAGITFINDAYNANPDSMKAALEALPPTVGKKIAVFSEMNALGEFSKKAHEEVARFALSHVDLLLCLGAHCATMEEVWKTEGRLCFFCQSKEELRKKLKEITSRGDVVLLKGARAYRMEDILECYS